MKISDLGGRRLAIWGMGAEALAALGAVRRELPGQQVAILEESAGAALPPEIAADAAVTLRRGRVTEALLAEFEIVIRSPGVSIYREEVLAAKKAGVQFTSGTNLWFAEHGGSRTICVTGSKGKSTTTHLLCHLLNSLGVRAAMAGNIGCPLLSASLPADLPVYVVELSSYQLSDFTGEPAMGILLNLYPEHLDWHRGEEAYFRDKARLLPLVTGSRVINREDERTPRYTAGLERLAPFNAAEGFHHDATTVYRRGEPWVTLGDLQLLGAHNLSNICAALTAVFEHGLAPGQEEVAEILRGFKGLRHRLTRLGEIGGVLYVNDSIATIPQATVAALECFSGREITLIAGGFDRGLDQEEFARMIARENPFAVITLPDTGRRLAECLRGGAAGGAAGAGGGSIHEAADLDHAVALAREITPSGGVVLLSPGAPSFNSHRNFAERGDAFARAAGFGV